MTTATPSPPTAQRPAAPDVVQPRSPAGVWWRVYRHHLRVLRTSSIAWIVGLTGVSAGVVATFEHRIGTEAERQALAAMEGIPAFTALTGRFVQVGTAEGFVLGRWGMFGILAAVWAMLAAVRLLRGAEESGHVEPLRAGAIPSRGLVTSTLAALFTVYALFAVAIGVTHTAVGMDAATAWALGGAVALLAATFAAAGAVASQLAPTRRRAAGLAGAFLGVALGVRVLAAATTTPDWVWWATPFGWMGFLHEVDDARAGVFTGFAVLLIVLMAAAVALARRDLHAGLAGGGEGSSTRALPLRRQSGLALRLTAGSATTWGVIVAVLVAVLGLLARDFVEAMEELATMVEVVRELFGLVLDTPEGMLAATFFFVAVLLAAAAAGQAAAMREEEATWRLEHLLARPLSRTRWLVTRALTSAGALLALAVGGGLVGWAATGISGAPVALGDALLGGVNVLPVAWLVLGVGVAVLGLAPRLTAPLTYGLVTVAFLLDFVGPFLDLPAWLLDASPFRHLTAVPAVEMNVGAALVMLAVGVTAGVVGVLAFRRRDLKEA
jgi:ABC-2 type transport system permease protein